MKNKSDTTMALVLQSDSKSADAAAIVASAKASGAFARILSEGYGAEVLKRIMADAAMQVASREGASAASILASLNTPKFGSFGNHSSWKQFLERHLEIAHLDGEGKRVRSESLASALGAKASSPSTEGEVF